VSLREHGRGDAGSVPVSEFIERVRREIHTRSQG
jgi:hypothetical protein